MKSLAAKEKRIQELEKRCKDQGAEYQVKIKYLEFIFIFINKLEPGKALLFILFF